MGKLSSIEDVEKRAEEEAFAAAQAATQREDPTQAHAAAGATGQRRPAAGERSQAGKQQRMPQSADEEAEFHGIDNPEPLGFAHNAVVTIAVVAMIAIVIYIANSWCHFF